MKASLLADWPCIAPSINARPAEAMLGFCQGSSSQQASFKSAKEQNCLVSKQIQAWLSGSSVSCSPLLRKHLEQNDICFSSRSPACFYSAHGRKPTASATNCSPPIRPDSNSAEQSKNGHEQTYSAGSTPSKDASEPSPQDSRSGIWSPSSASLAIAAALGAASSVAVKVVKPPLDNGNGEASIFSAPSEDFIALCEAQLDLCARVLAPEDNLTVYMRTPESYATGQLELRCVACRPDSHEGAHQGDLILLATDSEPAQGRAAETTLVAHEAVELPERGALVLPLAKGSFVVGLLVAERSIKQQPVKPAKPVSVKAVRPVWPPPNRLPTERAPALEERRKPGQEQRNKVSTFTTSSIAEGNSLTSGVAPLEPDFPPLAPELAAKSVFSTREQAEAAKVAHTLALACVMDQRALLVQQSAWQKGVLMDGLLEEVRAPLVAFRALGRMLLPQLRQGELSRDIVDTMISQGDRVKEVFDRLQLTLYPTQGTERLMQYESPASSAQLERDVAPTEPPREPGVQQLLPAPGPPCADQPALPFTLSPFKPQQQHS